MYRQLQEYRTYTPQFLLQIAVIGFIVGSLTWLLSLGLEKYVISAWLCKGSVSGVCGSLSTASLVISIIIMQFAGLVALVRTDVLRPLLVIIAVIMSLWGFQLWLEPLNIWLGALYLGLLSAIAYLLFVWIDRALYFPFALIMTVIAVIAARLLVMAL